MCSNYILKLCNRNECLYDQIHECIRFCLKNGYIYRNKDDEYKWYNGGFENKFQAFQLPDQIFGGTMNCLYVYYQHCGDLPTLHYVAIPRNYNEFLQMQKVAPELSKNITKREMCYFEVYRIYPEEDGEWDEMIQFAKSINLKNNVHKNAKIQELEQLIRNVLNYANESDEARMQRPSLQYIIDHPTALFHKNQPIAYFYEQNKLPIAEPLIHVVPQITENFITAIEYWKDEEEEE